ncbi:MAG: S8 family serine peptidase [candidate division Zixibacteria bacterium]
MAGAVSAIINNNLGTVGIAPGCPTISARCYISVVGSPCSGNWNANYSWTSDALNWGFSQGSKISNNSNGFGSPSSTVTARYTATYNGGMVHFASAGNNNSSSISYPANLSNVNAISALHTSGNRAGFSNFGAGISVSAPGEHIYLPDRTGSAGYSFTDYTYINGTSFASPYTAGVAALMLSQNPALTPAVLESRLRCSAVDYGAPGFDIYYGDGFVNAYNALTYADTDGDGIFDQCDNCLFASNFDQADSDDDGIGNACDNCPDDANSSQDDVDGDGVGDLCDNCPEDANPNQEDLNGNDVGDVCDWICGDVDGIAGVNILDIVFIINYKYKFGSAPDPMDAADVDGISPVNILDIVYLIAEIYKDGPALNCP